MTLTPDRLRLLHGTDAPFADMRLLRAGPATVLLDGVDLRYLRIGGTELVRRVYAAVRDVDWDTVPGVVSGLEIEESDDGFRVEFDVRHARREVDFAWHGTITGAVTGRVEYVFDGRAGAAFPFGRIGLCVHHPWRETAGARFTARTPGGEIDGAFPDLIGPQSFDGKAYSPLFPSFDHLEVELAGRGSSRLRLRGRPVGSRRPSKLDRRELQDVLDADQPRPATAARAGTGAPTTSRRRTCRRLGGDAVVRPCAPRDRRSDGNRGSAGRARPGSRPSCPRRARARGTGGARTSTSTSRAETRRRLAFHARGGTGDCDGRRRTPGGVTPPARTAGRRDRGRRCGAGRRSTGRPGARDQRRLADGDPDRSHPTGPRGVGPRRARAPSCPRYSRAVPRSTSPT